MEIVCIEMKCWFLITVKLKNVLLDLNSNHLFLSSKVHRDNRINKYFEFITFKQHVETNSQLLRMYLTCQQLIKTPSGILRWYLRVRITWVLISSFLILTHTISCTYLCYQAMLCTLYSQCDLCCGVGISWIDRV